MEQKQKKSQDEKLKQFLESEKKVFDIVLDQGINDSCVSYDYKLAVVEMMKERLDEFKNELIWEKEEMEKE